MKLVLARNPVLRIVTALKQGQFVCAQKFHEVSF